ncbi:hypothetical protein IT408_04655 [Candidatus Uhrbacteria bacterium]|nr:hypothetical protein [Candidatus Uhrbacteria bacterium]
MSWKLDADAFYQKRLGLIRDVVFPQNVEAVLHYLGLIGDVFRLRGMVGWGAEFELEDAKNFFNAITPVNVDEALRHVSVRSSVELAEQPDVRDACALITFILDRDRLDSIKVALDQLHLHRRWSEGMFQHRQNFEHLLVAYGIWLETQYVVHAVNFDDLIKMFGERSVLHFSPRFV